MKRFLYFLLLCGCSYHPSNEKIPEYVDYSYASIPEIDYSNDTIHLITVDSLKYFDLYFHVENLNYIFSKLSKEKKSSYINYDVQLGQKTKHFEKSNRQEREYEAWLANFKGYEDFFVYLRANREFRKSGSMYYNYCLSTIKDVNIKDNNIYTVFRMFFSKNRAEKDLALYILERMHRILEEDKKSNPQKLDNFNALIKELNGFK